MRETSTASRRRASRSITPAGRRKEHSSPPAASIARTLSRDAGCPLPITRAPHLVRRGEGISDGVRWRRGGGACGSSHGDRQDGRVVQKAVRDGGGDGGVFEDRAQSAVCQRTIEPCS